MEVEQAPPHAPPQSATVQPKLAVIQEARFAQNSPGIIAVIVKISIHINWCCGFSSSSLHFHFSNIRILSSNVKFVKVEENALANLLKGKIIL